MIKLNFVQNIEDPKLKGFALRLRELAFDDSLVIKYNKKDIAEKLGVSANTLRKYLTKLEELDVVKELKLNVDYFVVRESEPVIYLSDDRMQDAKKIIANAENCNTKLYKQMSYFMNNKLYYSPKANELYMDILSGLFGIENKPTKAPINYCCLMS